MTVLSVRRIAAASRAAACLAAAVSVSVAALAATPLSAAQADRPNEGFHHYVLTTMKFGTTANEADSYGFDLDNRLFQGRDNNLGKLFAALSSVVDADAPMAAAIESGEVVTLSSLRAHKLNKDRYASWQVYSGNAVTRPAHNGPATYTVNPLVAAGTELLGTIEQRQFNGGPGAMTIQLGLVPGQAPVELHLIGARVQAHCDKARCDAGKLGGGVLVSEINSQIIPALASMMQRAVDAGCPDTPDSCSPSARQILDLFDHDRDGTVSAEELETNALIQGVLSPDQDLLKADGTPGRDGVRESVSLGMGFTARKALFNVAGERFPDPATFPPLPVPFTAETLTDYDFGESNSIGKPVSISGSGTVPLLGTVQEVATGSGGILECPELYGTGGFAADGSGLAVSAVVALVSADGKRLCFEYHLTFTDVGSPPEGLDFSVAGQFAIRGGTDEFADAIGHGTITGTCTSYSEDPILNCQNQWIGQVALAH